MIRVLCLLVALSVAACGGEQPPPSKSEESTLARTSGNGAPVISSVRFVPDSPGVGDVLSVAIRTIDPDGDRLEIEVDWYRNGSVEQSGRESRLDTAGFNPGDRVWAEVWVSDGEEEVTHTTHTLTFENQPPQVLAVRVVPEKATGADVLMVEARAIDRDDDPYELQYRWYINGQRVSDATGASLEPGRARRGDSIEAEVSASDAAGEGAWVRSPAVDIRNSPPVITSRPSEGTVGEGRYSYQLRAEDPDGDRPLRYALVEGPTGLKVDLVSGVVSWQVPGGEGGVFPVRVSVTDPRGALTEQDYTLTLSWATEPASAADGDEEAAGEAREHDDDRAEE
jgi:hypothetical protein